MNVKKNVKVTDSAREKIMEAKERGHYVRVDLVKSGCCSMAFAVFEDTPKGDDEIIEVDGLQLVFSPRAKETLELGTIDYGRRGIRTGFFVKLA